MIFWHKKFELAGILNAKREPPVYVFFGVFIGFLTILRFSGFLAINYRFLTLFGPFLTIFEHFSESRLLNDRILGPSMEFSVVSMELHWFGLVFGLCANFWTFIDFYCLRWIFELFIDFWSFLHKNIDFWRFFLIKYRFLGKKYRRWVPNFWKSV